jgi:hypothetical protein
MQGLLETGLSRFRRNCLVLKDQILITCRPWIPHPVDESRPVHFLNFRVDQSI